MVRWPTEGNFSKDGAMCGIIGYVGRKESSPILIEGLRRLEYRGYDSAGLAVLSGGALAVRNWSLRSANAVMSKSTGSLRLLG